MKGEPTESDLWGKRRDEPSGGPSWHPLIDHSIDVACMLRQLAAHPTLRRRLARAGGVPDLAEAHLDQLAYLAFLHDLGKCSLGFRAKAVHGLAPPAGHLAALKPLVGEGPGAADLARAIDACTLQRWAGDAVDDLLRAVFAHHGSTPELDYERGPDHVLWKGWTARGREPLARLCELAAAGRAAFPAAFAADVAPLPASPAFQHLFAGLLMLADWLGSDDRPERFPYSVPGAPPRFMFARDRAGEVLASIAFAPFATTPPLGTFSEQFHLEPRPIQAAIDDVPLPGAEGSLVLIESETGSGKTEVALRWASRLIRAGLVDGCFFAVPLRSAALQLHARVQRWAHDTYGSHAPEVLLAVPGYLRMGDAEGTALPDFRVQWSDAETTDRAAQRWAAEQPKRYAAAALAVGTVDQALLGALQVRHAHLRAACLVRHLLVIDEVHASDAHMTELVLRLLALFRAVGGHVLLMSATLGSTARARLFQESESRPSLESALAVAYPRITASHTEPITPSGFGNNKRVVVEPLEAMRDATAVARRAAEAARAGARVVVLRNTVGAAIRTQEALETTLGPDHPALFRVAGIVTLHHGRFAAEDRRRLDEAVEARLGKNSPSAPAVVVATQTLEQSLDVDADLLITDLCPIDVLLQRIGRLHRHAGRGRPAGFGSARCVVLMPPGGDLTPNLSRAADGIGPDRAYESVVAVEAARRLVGEGAVWAIPDDNRRLVEQGTHPAALEAIAGQCGAAWLRHFHATCAGTIQQRAHARDRSIRFTERFSDLRWPDGAERLRTRLGEDDLILPIDRPLPSPFGNQIARMRVPGWMIRQTTWEWLKTIDEPSLSVESSGELALGEQSFIYDRLGLRPTG